MVPQAQQEGLAAVKELQLDTIALWLDMPGARSPLEVGMESDTLTGMGLSAATQRYLRRVTP